MTTGTLPSGTGQESASTSSIRSQLVRSLSASKEYRHAFLEEIIRTRIAAQIKAMRERAPWDLKTFAEKLHKKTSWSYRLEDPNLPPPTIPTLLQVAEVFDVGLAVRLVPFSELVDDITTLEPASFEVVGFEEDAGLIERKPHQSAFIFRGTEQTELVNRQLTPVPSALEPAQRRGNLNLMQPPVQAVAVQPSHRLGGWAGL